LRDDRPSPELKADPPRAQRQALVAQHIQDVVSKRSTISLDFLSRTAGRCSGLRKKLLSKHLQGAGRPFPGGSSGNQMLGTRSIKGLWAYGLAQLARILLTSVFCSGIFGYVNYLVERDRKFIIDTLINGTSASTEAELPSALLSTTEGPHKALAGLD
jgi:hypothetical protein